MGLVILDSLENHFIRNLIHHAGCVIICIAMRMFINKFLGFQRPYGDSIVHMMWAALMLYMDSYHIAWFIAEFMWIIQYRRFFTSVTTWRVRVMWTGVLLIVVPLPRYYTIIHWILLVIQPVYMMYVLLTTEKL